MTPAELFEIDDVIGQPVVWAASWIGRQAVFGQASAKPPHDGPDDEERDELDEKHPLELDTFGRWSSRAQPERVACEAEGFEAVMGLR